ncbi:hypothetical protein BH10PSE5_BH10PSE5_08610 [soil metagenome]
MGRHCLAAGAPLCQPQQRHRQRAAPFTASGPEKIVFVGGAPRSGTTVAHALICSADGVSPYHPEASFLRGLLPAWRNGKVAWDSHTKAFFDDMEAFRLHMRATVDLSLLHLWDVLERPAIRSLKDPHLAPFFRDLRELHPDISYFVTTCRNPLDVVRSRQEVHEKGEARPFSGADAAVIAREYVAYYTSITDRFPCGSEITGRLMRFAKSLSCARSEMAGGPPQVNRFRPRSGPSPAGAR